MKLLADTIAKVLGTLVGIVLVTSLTILIIAGTIKLLTFMF